MTTWTRLRKRSTVLRKGSAYLKHVPQMWRALTATPDALGASPPVIANSFPKSGTHLLDQIVGAWPGVVDHGRFLASTPSLTMRERSQARTEGILHRLAPGELLRAHLFHSPRAAAAVVSRNAAHFFIYRDPRDVVLSEAHYLATMNRWHRLHKVFRDAGSTEARVSLSILGAARGEAPADFPDVATRFARYALWLKDPNVCAVRFEDLRGQARDTTLRGMAMFYAARRRGGADVDDLIARSLANIAPERSHTFREGGSGGWAKAFTPRLKDEMKQVAGQLLIDLGYENDLGW